MHHGWKPIDQPPPKRILVDLWVNAENAVFTSALGVTAAEHREPDCYFHRGQWRSWHRGWVIKKSRVLFWRPAPQSPYDPYPAPVASGEGT